MYGFDADDFEKEFDDMFEDMDVESLLNETDPKVLIKKEVGDIVTIIDYSAVSDESGKEIEDDDIDMADEFIVIEINQSHKIKTKYITYNQDLIVINRRTNIKYRTPSYYTRIN
jgi:hypothetical protein